MSCTEMVSSLGHSDAADQTNPDPYVTVVTCASALAWAVCRGESREAATKGERLMRKG